MFSENISFYFICCGHHCLVRAGRGLYVIILAFWFYPFYFYESDLVEWIPDVVIPRNQPLDRVPDKVHVDRARKSRVEFRKVEKILVLQKCSFLFNEECLFQLRQSLEPFFKGVVKQGPCTCRTKRYVGPLAYIDRVRLKHPHKNFK